jgi:hypothetical protein
MGYLRITRPDGTEIVFGEEDDIEVFEVCDLCNEPRAESEMVKTNLATTDEQKLGINDVIWECFSCKGVNKS